MSHGMKKEVDKSFGVRKPLWHFRQTGALTLDSAPTRQEAEELVGNYQVIREPLYRKVPIITDDGDLTHEFIVHEEEQLNVRSDTGKVFGAVPTERVDPQPAEVWDIAEFVMDHNKNVVIETSGTYNEGADMFILLKLDEPITVKGDKHGDSYAFNALQNAWYTGKSLRFQLTNIRVECQNMSQLADFVAESRGLNLSLSHTINLRERIEEVQDFMASWRDGIMQWRSAKEHMAEVKVNVEQTEWFLKQFIPSPADDVLISQQVRDNIEIARTELIMEIFSDLNTGIRGTALGLFEGASSYETHVRKATSDITRFKRAMLTPTTILADAASLALEAANV